MNLDTNEKMKFDGLQGKEILEVLYNKELSSKKTVLECAEIVKNNKDNLNEEQLQEVYKIIYKSIEAMNTSVKPNTIMFLKNQLKAILGKLVKEKDPKEINHFIEFFKAAYPAGNRKKDFTWVLMDIRKITDEQIWTTLTYINAWCLQDKNNNLTEAQKEDIIKMAEVLVNRGSLKYINQLKSFSKLQNILKIKIVSTKDKFKVKKVTL